LGGVRRETELIYYYLYFLRTPTIFCYLDGRTAQTIVPAILFIKMWSGFKYIVVNNMNFTFLISIFIYFLYSLECLDYPQYLLIFMGLCWIILHSERSFLDWAASYFIIYQIRALNLPSHTIVRQYLQLSAITNRTSPDDTSWHAPRSISEENIGRRKKNSRKIVTVSTLYYYSYETYGTRVRCAAYDIIFTCNALRGKSSQAHVNFLNFFSRTSANKRIHHRNRGLHHFRITPPLRRRRLNTCSGPARTLVAQYRRFNNYYQFTLCTRCYFLFFFPPWRLLYFFLVGPPPQKR